MDIRHNLNKLQKMVYLEFIVVPRPWCTP